MLVTEIATSLWEKSLMSGNAAALLRQTVNLKIVYNANKQMSFFYY